MGIYREASNASQIRRNFEDSAIHYVPKIYWEYTVKHQMLLK
ncbi:AarF/UbiB family protein, partial [Francisella tularensis]